MDSLHVFWACPNLMGLPLAEVVATQKRVSRAVAEARLGCFSLRDLLHRPPPQHLVFVVSRTLAKQWRFLNGRRVIDWSIEAFRSHPEVDEIIIVDTGSTDDTVSIAGQFTDKVFHFEWCDDFSAARNFAIEQATGDVADLDEHVEHQP